MCKPVTPLKAAERTEISTSASSARFSAFSGSILRHRRGFTEENMVIVADLISDVLEAPEDEQVLARVRKEVQALTAAHPLFYE